MRALKYFLCCLSKQAVEPTVIWDTLTLLWRLCNIVVGTYPEIQWTSRVCAFIWIWKWCDNGATLHRTHYSDVILSAIASQLTGVSIIYSTASSDADQRKHQSFASLAFVRVIHRSPVNYPHKRPVTGKMFSLDDVIMQNKHKASIYQSMFYSPWLGVMWRHIDTSWNWPSKSSR